MRCIITSALIELGARNVFTQSIHFSCSYIILYSLVYKNEIFHRQAVYFMMFHGRLSSREHWSAFLAKWPDPSRNERRGDLSVWSKAMTPVFGKVLDAVRDQYYKGVCTIAVRATRISAQILSESEYCRKKPTGKDLYAFEIEHLMTFDYWGVQGKVWVEDPSCCSHYLHLWPTEFIPARLRHSAAIALLSLAWRLEDALTKEFRSCLVTWFAWGRRPVCNSFSKGSWFLPGIIPIFIHQDSGLTMATLGGDQASVAPAPGNPLDS